MVSSGQANPHGTILRVKNEETRLQCAVVDYMRRVCPDCLTFHNANGGKRTVETARLMKRLGVLAGVFDLTILAPGPFLGFMEVKVGNEKLSENQEWFRTQLIKMGFQYCVVRSLDDVKAAIIQWRLPSRLAKC
jgi:hypothetical protein